MSSPTRQARIAITTTLLTLAILIIIAADSRPALATPAAPGSSSVLLADPFPNHTFVLPVDITHAGDARLFIVEQPGLIRVLSGPGPAATNKLFLDIHERIPTDGEMGLLALAFHPNYQENGTFYVHYTQGEGKNRESVISSFQVSADPDAADPSSELILLTIPQPYTNHNGGGLEFAPDGTLYISIGDGGGAGDPDNRAQDGTQLLGKMLRIDVDKKEPGKNYAIPADNPFIGQPTLDEIWATGLRNPWRFSFDRLSGDLYIGDVGQGAWEEINFQPANSSGGQNYGWRLKEGTHCFNPLQECDPGGLTDPVYEYGHDQGCSITGGFVYRGPAIAELQGYYLYADFCSGVVWALHRDGGGVWHNAPLISAGGHVTTFGEDVDGEIYLALRRQGKIVKLVRRQAIFLPVIIKE